MQDAADSNTHTILIFCHTLSPTSAQLIASSWSHVTRSGQWALRGTDVSHFQVKAEKSQCLIL